jgi:ribosomal protein L11 methyltransferase
MVAREVHITLHPLEPFRDLLVFYMGQHDYHGFEYDERGLKAYVDHELFTQADLIELLKLLDGKAEYTWETQLMPDINWNEAWEKDFKPVDLGNGIRIRAPFHESDASASFEIIIEPKMSFGTGHHATTAQMMSMMLSIPFQGKHVLDMGSGTGILAILAEKLGAHSCQAIDYDEWCYKNAVENVELNNCTHIEVIHGDVHALANKGFDIVLANINKNILLADSQAYALTLKPNGIMLMSGFYEADLPDLVAHANTIGLEFEEHTAQDRWVCARFKKIAS